MKSQRDEDLENDLPIDSRLDEGRSSSHRRATRRYGDPKDLPIESRGKVFLASTSNREVRPPGNVGVGSTRSRAETRGEADDALRAVLPIASKNELSLIEEDDGGTDGFGVLRSSPDGGLVLKQRVPPQDGKPGRPHRESGTFCSGPRCFR